MKATLILAGILIFGAAACSSAANGFAENASANNSNPVQTATPPAKVEKSGAQNEKSENPAAGQTNFTSVYTDMKRDCKALPNPPGTPEGTDPLVACKGFGGYRILIGYSALGAGIRVESVKNPEISFSFGEDYGGYGDKGEKAEWRMANGKPFAVIMRFGKYGAPGTDGNPFANRTGSKLVVKGLKGWERIEFEIDGAEAGANEKARRMADENYSKK